MSQWHRARVYPVPEQAPTPYEEAMPIRSRLRVLLHRHNLRRAEAGDKSISVRELSRRTGIAYSGLRNLIDNKTTRVDFDTLDRLMQFFETDSLDDLLEYSPPGGRDQQGSTG